MHPGDYCLSHDISQCYPERHPMVPPGGYRDEVFMRLSWKAVQDTLVAGLGRGVVADAGSFDPADLQRSLQMAIRKDERVRMVDSGQ